MPVVLLFHYKKLNDMSLVLTGLGLAASTVGSGIQAYQTAKNQENYEAGQDRIRGALLTEKYRNPFEDPSNKVLLTGMRRDLQKNTEAVLNNAAASGATFENTLAAKQAANEAVAEVNSAIFQNQAAKESAINQQLLNLDMQRNAQKFAAGQQAAQGWASMGDAAFGAFTDLGGTMLENGIALKDLFKFKGA